MSRQTALVVALSSIAVAGGLASLVAWVLLWRDIRAHRAGTRAEGAPADTTSEE